MSNPKVTSPDVTEEQAFETLNAVMNAHATHMDEAQLLDMIMAMREQRKRWVKNTEQGKKVLAKSEKVRTNIPAGTLVAQGAAPDIDDLLEQ